VTEVKIEVRYFGPVREKIGAESETWSFERLPTVADIRDEALRRFPALAGLLPSCRVAVDMTYVGEDVEVADGSEVAFIPPVAGG